MKNRYIAHIEGNKIINFDERGIETKILDALEKIADKHFDGHYTILKFTTNWKVSFFTPMSYEEIQNMPTGESLEEASLKCIELFQTKGTDPFYQLDGKEI